ncbi:MAG: adenosine deaminase, partial [Actinobacteria bacterium]|nr:adenosine deaminase [Actinomycetota bacterium]
ACGITWEEIGRLVENAIASSFAPLETRRAILDEVVRPAYASLAEG